MLTAPEPLAAHHTIGEFCSGVTSLDDWLRRRALQNQTSGASRTFVTSADGRVIGYHALASGSIALETATTRFKRNMPQPIPVMVLARLAVDQAWHGKGIGRALFRDAAMRTLNAADTFGMRGMIVHAVSEDAKAFYTAIGFDPSPIEPMTLMVTLADLRECL